MAVTGTWKARQSIQAGANKWGNGWNPVHALRDEESGGGPNISLRDYGGPWGAGVPAYTPDLPLEFESSHAYGYMMEDESSALWGYGTATGTADRPAVGNEQATRARTTDDFPSWGRYENGLPGGTVIRDRDHGAEATSTSKRHPEETVSEGWLNKVRSFVNPAGVSSPRQLVIQTAGMQLDTQRMGSQVPNDGRADEHDAPIKQRVPGMRVKEYSGGMRHYDMLPKAQDEYIRPWWGRVAGTGDPNLMAPNAENPTAPISRTPPDAPFQGKQEAPAQADVSAGQRQDTYGYVAEDMIPYA